MMPLNDHGVRALLESLIADVRAEPSDYQAFQVRSRCGDISDYLNREMDGLPEWPGRTRSLDKVALISTKGTGRQVRLYRTRDYVGQCRSASIRGAAAAAVGWAEMAWALWMAAK
jgi:hypothetical protein